MTRKSIIGLIVALLAAVGVYKFISTRQKQTDADDPWTAADIPDLSGKVIVVTGGNSGIGYEAAVEFARKGAQTILACRNPQKAEAALAQLQAEVPEAAATVMTLDLASLASVRHFAEAFQAKYDRLDVLVNNAGIMMVPHGTTEDGFERQFGTNHLGHFALTGLLLDTLLATPRARVVNVSSTGHRTGTMDFDNLMFAGGDGYSPLAAYGRSKLANLLFTYELQRRFEGAGADAMAVAAHPGGSNTNLADHLQDKWYFQLFGPLVERMMQSAAMGALPTERAAVDADVHGGSYYGPNGFMEQGGFPVVVQSSDGSHSVTDAQQLWRASEALTGVTYDRLDKTVALGMPDGI